MATLGYRAEIDAGQRFVEGIEPDDSTVLLFHGDADGCSAGVIMYRTLLGVGSDMIFPVFMNKGESVYSANLAERVLAREPSRLIVMDTGSRTKAIVPGVTTMVIDHHRPEGVPPVDVFVTSYGVEPPATASVITYQICKDFVQVGGLDWLAAVGAVGDLGSEANFDVVQDARKLYTLKALKETAALVNAARRAPSHDVATAFGALFHADSPLDIVEGAVPEAERLREYREQVNAEFNKAMRTAPVTSGQWALLRFSSPALVHPLVAVAWKRRLPGNIVIAANYGYTEGNVHFSARSAMGVNLLEEFEKVQPVEADVEFGHGHPQATGGILPLQEFQDLLKRLGFPDDVAANRQ